MYQVSRMYEKIKFCQYMTNSDRLHLLIYLLVFLSLLIIIFQKTSLILRTDHEDFLGTSPFKELRYGNETFAATAYFQQDGRSVRIYLLRKMTEYPKIACSFPSQNHWNATDDCHGRTYKHKTWVSIRSQYQDFGVCCQLPTSFMTQRPSSIRIAITTDDGILESTQVILSIGEEPPINHNNFTFPHKFAVCIRPMFNMQRSLTRNYLIEYIEMVRRLGGNLLIFYLAEEPDARISQVLQSYLAEPGSGGPQNDFQIKVVNWYRPVQGELGATHLQVLAYNDCLFRFGRQVQYFHFTDLDELIVPHQSVGDTWNDLVRGLLEKGWDEKYASTCFNAITFLMRFTPLMNISIFYADQTIEQNVWRDWRKCLVKSAQLQWMWVHSPMEPSSFFDGNSVGTVYHYFRCDLFKGSYCVKPKNITTNRVLWAHRISSESAIAYRHRLLQI